MWVDTSTGKDTVGKKVLILSFSHRIPLRTYLRRSYKILEYTECEERVGVSDGVSVSLYWSHDGRGLPSSLR